MLAVLFGLSTAGCPDPHLQERGQNALIGAGHQAALEQCLHNLDKDLLAGKSEEEAWKAYDECADDAEPGR
jgi:hypothetical protein